MKYPKNWTRHEITTHLQINNAQYGILINTFLAILQEDNLYGQKLNKAANKKRLQICIDKNLQKLPDFVRNQPVDLRNKVLKGLAHRIQFNWTRSAVGRQQKTSTSQRAGSSDASSLRQYPAEENPPAVLASEPDPTGVTELATLRKGIQFYVLEVVNTIDPENTSLCMVGDVLSGHSTRASTEPVTLEDLDFEKWKNIIKADCGYDQTTHVLHYRHDGFAIAIENYRN